MQGTGSVCHRSQRHGPSEPTSPLTRSTSSVRVCRMTRKSWPRWVKPWPARWNRCPRH